MRKLLACFLLLICAENFFGQHPYFYSFNTENGLPSNEVYYVFQDAQSFIWLGTSAGLFRFDGKSFKLMSNRQQNSRAISNLQSAPDGKLWCQNFTGQIFYVENDSLYFAEQQSIKQSNYPHFKVTASNTIYLSCDSGVLVFQRDKKALLRLPKINPHKHQACFVTDLLFANNMLFVAERDVVGYFIDAVFKEVSKTNRVDKLKDVYRQTFLYEIAGKVLVLAHGEQQNSIWQIRNDSIIWLRDLPASLERVYALHPDSKGHIWIGSSNGVLCLDNNLNDQFGGRIFFQGKSISDVLADEEGNYWFSTLSDGVLVIPSLDVWIMNDNNSALPNQRIKQLKKDANGNLFVGLLNGILCKWNLHTNKIQSISFPHSAYEIQSLFFDSSRNQLLVGQNNFWSIESSTLTVKRIPVIENVKAMTPAFIPNELFIGTVNFGATAVWKAQPELKQILREKRVRCAAYSTENNKLFVGYSDGLWQYTQATSSELNWRGAAIYANDVATCVNGITYIATKDGLFAFDNVSVKPVEVLQNQFVSKLHCSGNTLWCVAQNNLLKYNIIDNTVLEFNRFDGLASTEISGIETINRKVYLATSKGLIFFPDSLQTQNSVPPKIFITRFAIHEIDTTLFTSYTLPFAQNNVTIHFNAIAFRAQGNYTFKYRLLGLDSTWIIENSNSNFARFPSLPAGDYMFEVKAINEDGVESKHAATVQISILKPYWQTWWFFVLCALFLIGVVSALFAWRIHQIRKKAALEKSMANLKLTAIKSQMNPHFMFNALTSIQDLILRHQIEESNYYLGKFSELTRKVLEASGEEFIAIEEEVKFLQLYLQLEALRFGADFQYEIKVANEIDQEVIKIPSMLIQPLVENALKHGLLHKKGAKHLSVSFFKMGVNIVCEVNDNGIGRDASTKINKLNNRHRPFATKAIEERLHILKECYGIEVSCKIIDKEEGKGTKAILTFPLSL